jgi:hypothetical protein
MNPRVGQFFMTQRGAVPDAFDNIVPPAGVAGIYNRSSYTAENTPGDSAGTTS